MYLDSVVIAGVLAVLATIIVVGGVVGFIIKDARRKR
ncbi:cytochrome c oxidase subunit CcoM [Endozoicomonas ascidiicola]|nr:cytochrome c oxidase subunit CcoM [Endozoicomonas ascidiicola]